MTLTDAQIRQLGTHAEWREIQKSMYNVYAYLTYTNLENIKIQEVIQSLNGISMRRAAFLEQFTREQGGV